MHVNQIQNNNPQFQGVIKIQDLKKGGKVLEKKTEHEFDRDLSAVALKTVFDGNWANEGTKNINSKKLALFLDILRLTIGIDFIRNNKETVSVVLKHLNNGYSIKSENNYQITHLREDHVIWG